jgi:hypothetical protein
LRRRRSDQFSLVFEYATSKVHLYYASKE